MRFYASIYVLPYDVEAQLRFAHLRRQQVRIGTQDLRIAAIALSQNATLVTRNRRDFAKVPGLQREAVQDKVFIAGAHVNPNF